MAKKAKNVSIRKYKLSKTKLTHFQEEFTMPKKSGGATLQKNKTVEGLGQFFGNYIIILPIILLVIVNSIAKKAADIDIV